jgi:hypothetical protein
MIRWLFLLELQDLSKTWTDEKKVKVVFVSSTGNAVFMRGRSSWSRCDSVVEVGEVSFEDGLKFLLGKGMPEQIAKDCVFELTGSRVSLLKEMAFLLSSGVKYEALKEQQMQEVKGDFARAGFFMENDRGIYIKSIIQALCEQKDGKLPIESTVIHQKHWEDLFPILPNSQVIAHHASDNSVTFESQRAATFAKSIYTSAK